MASTLDELAIADWRRGIAALYGIVRGIDDGEEAWGIWRRTRDTLFRHHPASPLGAAARQGFAGLPCYDYDPSLRLLADLDPIGDAPAHDLDLGADGRLILRPLARTRGLTDLVGGELTVFWLVAYGGGLFLPFADATSGTETYGGGRYLLDTVKGADLGMRDGRLVVDFNFAYYPSCAYDARWTCPLPPPENRLPAPVQAGECS